MAGGCHFFGVHPQGDEKAKASPQARGPAGPTT